MSSILKKAAVVSIPTVRQALARSNPVLANALLAKRQYSKGGVEVIIPFPSPQKILDSHPTTTPSFGSIPTDRQPLLLSNQRGDYSFSQTLNNSTMLYRDNRSRMER